MFRELISIRSVAAFGGFFAIILAGSVGLTRVRELFAAPRRALATGGILILVAMAGLWWLVKFGPESERGRSSWLAGLGGALGVLLIDSIVSNSLYVAIGAGIGAGAFAVIGTVLPRTSWVDLEERLPWIEPRR